MRIMIYVTIYGDEPNKKAMTCKVIAFLLGSSLSCGESLQAPSYDEAAKRVLTTDYRLLICRRNRHE